MGDALTDTSGGIFACKLHGKYRAFSRISHLDSVPEDSKLSPMDNKRILIMKNV